MEQKYTIKGYYKRIFLSLVSIPLLLIFAISMIRMLVQVEEEQMQELMTTNESITTMLENEITEYSIALSNLVNANSQEVIELLNNYNNSTGTEQFLYNQELEYIYNIGFVQLEPLIATEFYFADGSKYGFEHDHIIDQEVAQMEEWYLESIEYPDIVRVSVVSGDTIIGRNAATVFDDLLMFSVHTVTLGAGTTVEMGNMCIESETLDTIANASDFTSNIEIYLIDAMGGVLVSSNDEYLEEIDEIYYTSKCSNNDVSFVKNKINKTSWYIITLANDEDMKAGYRNIILLMIGAISLVFILLYFFIDKLLTNIITPINQLSETMKKLSNSSQLEKCQVTGIYEIEGIETTYNQMVDEINNLIIMNRLKEEEKHAEEMKVLELQLNPHFLSNTLTNIRFMAIVAQFESIQKMTESLINILEVSFRNSDRFIKLSDEMVLTESYLYIMLIRYANNFEVIYEIEEGLDDYLVPKLIIQPFLENAITHGFESKDNLGEIRIKIKKIEKHILISIYDNGAGIEQERFQTILEKEPINGKHIGIANINKRLKLYYGEQYGIRIDSEMGQYTEMSFVIPSSAE